ncbi:MAG: chemotaxis protein CheW [Methylococcaceae bacterium]|nr:chemotaxis protein CheW [Methylococcaceae bacterium]
MTQETDTQEVKRTKSENSMQFLSFTLGEEEYGVDILSVQEIRSWEPVSRIPNVPSYEKGVVNLRGAIVPIIDLRERFNLEHSKYTNLTVVVVLQTILQGRSRTMGVVVDSVSDVNNIEAQSIQSAPDFGTKVSTEFISGLALVDERMLILLDVKKLLKLDGVDNDAEEDDDEN